MRSLLSNTRRPDITFHASGRIDITARVTKALAIGEGDVIDIATDGNEYYLYVRHRASDVTGIHEAQCHATKTKSRNLRCHSKRLCAAIMDVTGCGGSSSVRLPAGNAYVSRMVGETVLPLITRNPL